ncbi:hypothetical protein KKF60_00035 [Patescibacteria group bacterium]|nr:hypothetical protein [Patescibacteria group bacterium]MBU4458291.1 hypothetical protein [Patescibacteria group bacterium]MCG2696206.1 hypothetical protein [Candidatus Portnoybacteria bacterium]
MKKISIGLMFFLFVDLWIMAEKGGRSLGWFLFSLVTFLVALLLMCFLMMKRRKNPAVPTTLK